MDRIYRAFFNSAAGWRYALRNEKAVRQEVVVLAAVAAGGLLSSPTTIGTAWRWSASWCIVLAVEFLNTAIEKLADHVRPEIHPEIKIVKDLGQRRGPHDAGPGRRSSGCVAVSSASRAH